MKNRSALHPIKEIMSESDSEDVISLKNPVESALDHAFDRVSLNESSVGGSGDDETEIADLLDPVPKLIAPPLTGQPSC